MEPLCEVCQGTGTQANQADCIACDGLGVVGVIPIQSDEMYFDEKDTSVLF